MTDGLPEIRARGHELLAEMAASKIWSDEPAAGQEQGNRLLPQHAGAVAALKRQPIVPEHDGLPDLDGWLDGYVWALEALRRDGQVFHVGQARLHRRRGDWGAAERGFLRRAWPSLLPGEWIVAVCCREYGAVKVKATREKLRRPPELRQANARRASRARFERSGNSA